MTEGNVMSRYETSPLSKDATIFERILKQQRSLLRRDDEDRLLKQKSSYYL